MEQRAAARSGRGSAWYRRLVPVAAGLLLLTGVLVAVTVADDDKPAADQAPADLTQPPPSPPVTAPAAPTARVCGSTAALAGPATAPAGAVTVSTKQDLNDLTKASPPGTTFWLTPGTHTLAAGEFSQVIPKE